MLKEIQEIYQQFCKDTKRSGGVLVSSSITEWHTYLSNNLKPNKMTTEETITTETVDVTKPVPGSFQTSLQRSNKDIKNDRAIGIAEDAELTYQRMVQDLEVEYKRKIRERQNMLDLSPTNTHSLILASEFDSKKFVELDLTIGVQLREIEIKLDIARSRYAELFGA